jgi:hypothetical protein
MQRLHPAFTYKEASVLSYGIVSFTLYVQLLADSLTS